MVQIQPTMEKSMYDICQMHDMQRMEADVIYKAFFSRDTSELDKMLQEIHEITVSKISNLSTTYRKLTDRTIRSDARIAKHAYLLFGLYLTPEYARTLVEPTPRVDPVKFRKYYSVEIPKMCNNWFNGIYTSLQEFVEDARTTYIIM